MSTSDVARIPSEALESEIAVLSAQIDAAEHRLLTLVRELDARQRHRDHGLASMAAWLSWRVGLGPVAAREKVRVAKALGELPEIDAAFARAEVSYSKVRAMTRIATPENEGRLLHMAKNATAAQLETICRGVEQVTGRCGDGRARWVRLVPCKDGMVRLEARLHPDEAAMIVRAVDAAIEEAAAPGAAPAEASPAPRTGTGSGESRRCPEDACAQASRSSASAESPRSPAPVPALARTGASAEALVRREARPDGLVRVADAFLAGERSAGRPAAERHQIVVCVREDHLNPSDISVEVGCAGQAGAETLRRLACDTGITRVTVDDEGTPLDVGRKTRVVPPALRRALLVRDGGCRFPGCRNHRWVDAHHIQHWVDGGRTRRDNLVLLCSAHHRLVHEGGFKVSGDATNLRFARPDGSIIVAAPMACSTRAPLPTAKPPRAPPMLPPDYNWAIGAALPRVA